MVLLSAGLQIVIVPLPNQYMLCWVAIAPLFVALQRARVPNTLQVSEGVKLYPASPGQAFLLAYVCGILWYAGTCYWIYNTMRQYGGVSAPLGVVILILFSLYLALYHGAFGLLISLLTGGTSFSRRALLLGPVVWVGVELARTRITGFPWDLLGITQVDNIPLARIATVTGVYGLSFEIMVVNMAVAAAFLVRREKRKPLLLAALGAALVLQSGRWVPAPPFPADHIARLVQENIPVLENSEWTNEYLEGTLRDLTWVSLHPTSPNEAGANHENDKHPDLIVWPESPAPFYASDPAFREAVSNVARQAQTWVLVGNQGVRNASQTPKHVTEVYNSAALVSPAGEWVGRYDKVHLVPFGEYVPFKRIFSFAGGLTQQVGDFSRGTSRAPLQAGKDKMGVFICYESIFPDEVRQFAANGAQVFVNISNDGWYGDSGAYAQHLKQARMRAIENSRWLLRDTNTGVTASIDPYGRVIATVPRKLRVVLQAPYASSDATTFYTRHGDWFAYLCAIISLGALLMRLPFCTRTKR
ncbi:MAG: apolipoprotein N-acyltransferase [Acidobacteriales bacterium 13_2_20CM_55_8]|nr:MAG: apolipoprotein N-acyltransferase [Acidobacteriales bacterium 13_2_20CM_55_8]